MTKVKFFEPTYEPDIHLTYSVISSRYQGSWIYVRHHQRTTIEIPGGHIDEGETSFQAAERELMEETGATEFTLDCIATYSVEKNGELGYGRLYIAEVVEMGPIPDISEIAEVVLLDHLPLNLTHPDIQPQLFARTLEFMKARRQI